MVSSTYSGWIDWFCWGTSGYNHGAVCYQPWSTSSESRDFYAYGSVMYNLFDQNGKADWGYNKIINGGNQENYGWRTPTKEEWEYLIEGRNVLSPIRYACAKVNDAYGLILLPDNWSPSTYFLNYPNMMVSGDENVINSSDWSNKLEKAGAVFLPFAGMRIRMSPNNLSCHVGGDSGEAGYWSATTTKTEYRRYYLNILGSHFLDVRARGALFGFPVRLIKDNQ